MMHDTGQIHLVEPIQQRRQDHLVACHPQHCRHRVGDGQPDQFVAESDPVLGDRYHPPPLGRSQTGQAARHDCVHQPSLHRGGDDRQLLKSVPASLVQIAEPGSYRLGDGRRHASELI